MNKKVLLVLDWSNLMFRSLFMTHLFGQGINYNSKEDINAFVAKFTTDVLFLLKIFNPNNVILATDATHAWRKDILTGIDGYKSNRKKDDFYNWDNIFQASDDLQNIFKSKGITIAKVNHGEADDITALCKELIFEKYPDWNIIIVSADADIRQLIDFKEDTKQYCLVYNTIGKRKGGKRSLYVTKEFLNWFNRPQVNDIFFSNSDYSRDYISRLLVNNSTIDLVEENPNDVVLGKIFCGDDGDCVPAFYEYYKNGKKIRVTNSKFKKLQEALEFNNINELVDKDFLIKGKLSEILKHTIDDIDCHEILQRQRVLVELNSKLFPDNVKEYKNVLDKKINTTLNINYQSLKTITFLQGSKFEKVYQEQKAQEAEIFKGLDKYFAKVVK